MSIQESPWNIQISTLEHEQWFKNSVHLHQLTSEWISLAACWIQAHSDQIPMMTECTHDQDPEKRFVEFILREKEFQLSDLLRLDNTYPDQTIQRFEKYVWMIQAKILTLFKLKTKNLKSVDLLNRILQQTSEQLGKRYALQYWKRFYIPLKDVSSVLYALYDTPFSGFPNAWGLLVRRATAKEWEVDLRSCAHHQSDKLIQSIADDLCLLHVHWLKGFAETLNPDITIGYHIQKPGCRSGCRLIGSL